MTWFPWLPWHRWRAAELLADEAEQTLVDVLAERDNARVVAARAHALRATNGFTDAIRVAMGVHQ